MALRKCEAWVTSVVNEDSLESALVLAESLRQSKTTRSIVALTSQNVSLEKRLALRQAFDTVILLDETFVPDGVGLGKKGNAQAKAFTFGLTLFEKCVFISSTSMVTENADQLFGDMKCDLQCRVNALDGSCDLSLFVVKPSKELGEQVWRSVMRDGNRMSDEYLSKWLKNQENTIAIQVISTKMVTNFSLVDGTLDNLAFIPIVHLIDGVKSSVLDRMRNLQETEMGLLETRIPKMWMEFHEQVTTPRQLKTSMNNYGSSEPIAIVGMSCRYPGANSLDEFWQMLFSGEEGICEPPTFRWTKEHTVRVTQQDRQSSAGFLSCPVDEFDARFFGVSPKEAAYMDPQLRLLHEVLWESLEDAGIDPLSLYGTSTGIFTGSWMNDYKDIVTNSAEKDFFRTYLGNSIGAAAARLSFLLGLTGPSVATESGCSSAIVALHLAVQSLRAGETNLALAGGVNLLLHPFNSAMMEYVISPNGRCKTFDANADGFGRAEGCGVLVLKRLEDALRDRDHIWAVIRGSAVSQEGLSKSLGTPTSQCEALAMQRALQDANVSPEQISFVETHGTGTAVGDPLEVAAIAKAYYSPYRKKPLVIGSVKTNVGHTESCSGITGIMKAVLVLQHQLIPQHRNLETLNPEIFLDSIPAVIPQQNLPWPRIPDQPRICGVSSFGITGTDGHVIIEEAPDYTLPKFTLGIARPQHLIAISAKSSEALRELLTEYQKRFVDGETDDFADVAYSANVGRATFNHRAFLVAANLSDAAKIFKDKSFLQGEVKSEEGRNPHQICFLFTGQGSQYPGMAKTLYETSPVFRVHFDACDRLLRKLYRVSIKEVLWGETRQEQLHHTVYSQTSIFCLEYCLLKVWQSWGVEPDCVLGHSLGEFCAAVAAGVLEFEDALKLVTMRSLLIDQLPRGSMLVIRASQTQVENWMRDANVELDIAAVNTADQTVVAGDTGGVEYFMDFLKCRDVKATVLEASHAFHSHHMDPILMQYRQVAQTVVYKKGNLNVQYISGMEGRVIEDFSYLNADYWMRHTREKVNFLKASATLRECGYQTFLEVGPQPVLSSFVMTNNENTTLNCLPSLRKGHDDWTTMLTSLGKLYLLGYPVDWKGYDEPYLRKKVSVPFHPFHRKPFWVESIQNNVTSIHPLLGYPLQNASNLHIFQNDITLKAIPYLNDHCIGQRVVFPGACFTEMCLSAGYCVANSVTERFPSLARPLQLKNLRIDAPLELYPGKQCRFQVLVDLPDNKEGFRVKLFHQNAFSSEENGQWLLHASSIFVPVVPKMDHTNRTSRITELLSNLTATSPDHYYKVVEEQGLKFGPSFRTIQRYWVKKQENLKEDKDEVVTEIKIPTDCDKYVMHPLIIDAVFQTAILIGFRYETPRLKVPVRLGELTLFSSVNSGDHLYMHLSTTQNGKSSLFVTTSDWTPVALVQNLEVLDTNVRTLESVLEQQVSSLPTAWEETWKVLPAPFTNSLRHPVNIDHFLEKYKAQVPAEEDVVLYHKTQRLLYLLILKALQTLGWQPETGEMITVDGLCKDLRIKASFHHLVHFYLNVLEEEREYLKDRHVIQPLASCDAILEEIASLMTILKQSKVATPTHIYEHISNHLPKILTGEESSLQLLFPLDESKQQYSAESYYQNHPSRAEQNETVGVIGQAIVRQSFQRNGHLNPESVYRLLEVGSGTGSLCQHNLPEMRATWKNRFEYFYTDISQSFFAKAEKKFEEYRENLHFAVFNIEQSPLSQGIPVGYFDGVCASDVLHATRNLEETLVHLRQCLKPGGLIFFTETIVPARDISYVFGILEGYWRFEDTRWRRTHCCVNEHVWAEMLRRCGFEKVNSVKMYMGQFACITAVAKETVQVERMLPPPSLSTKKNPGWAVFSRVDDLQVMAPVANMLLASGYPVNVILRQDEHYQSTEGLLMPEVGTKRIQENDEEAMKQVIGGEGNLQGILYAWGTGTKETEQRKIALPFFHMAKVLVGLVQPPKLFVLTQGQVSTVKEDEGTLQNPSAATLQGMVKSLKNETFNLFARCVDLEKDSTTKEKIFQILYELAMTKSVKEAHRLQVAYRGRVRQEPRLLKATLPTPKDALKLPVGTDRYKLKLPASRVIQDLEFEPLEEIPVGNNEVEVKVQTFALNFRDIFTILKPIPESEKWNTVGLDYAGVVTKVGKSSSWKVGDRVLGANFKEAQLPSHLTVHSKTLLRIPSNMSFNEAATLPAVFFTAYHCLINVAQIRKGQTVLIHTASGGVGLAAVQLAKHVGTNIIATAGNSRKRAYLRNLGIEHVFHSRDTRYERNILRVTQGRGVDVVLNSITGPGFKEATLKCTANGGRFVEMSKLNVWASEKVGELRPDVLYYKVDLMQLDKPTFETLTQRMREQLEGGKLKAIPYVKFDALHLRQALQYFQRAKHIGKVVVTMPQVSTQDGQFKTEVPLFNSDSTYLITGGFGGIGLEVCKWMLKMGAKDIALVGRNPPKPEVAQQVKMMNEKGANVMIRLGDVGDSVQCQKLIQEIGGKPLRGVMHCAGVLRDNLYSNQTWLDFEAVYKPKVQGTWNLHNFTRNSPLEYFVVFSSLTALVGTPGQPNHSSANCFQDAFIHYRHSLGLPGTSINWGQWAQVGCAREANLSGVFPVSVQRMLKGLETALRSQKRQVCFSEFDSFANFSLFCPTFKGYLDERLWKQSGQGDTGLSSVSGEQFWKEMDGVIGKPEEMTIVLKKYLKKVLRAALRLEPDEPISDTANLQDLGVDSLMMIELRNTLQALLGNRLTVAQSEIKNCNTVASLANRLVGKLREEAGGAEETIQERVPLEPLPTSELLTLLHKDALLDESIKVDVNVITTDIKSILVTGATGQVAPYLIAQLCHDYPSVEKILCLVRQADESADLRLKKALEYLKVDLEKVKVITGDVAHQNLGMSPENYEHFCNDVDAIIHCAAKTHFTEHFRHTESLKRTDIRSVNIEGTVNVLRFASRGKLKRVYYPSTLLSGLFGGHGQLDDSWPDNSVIDTIVNNQIPGLQSSKWICEMLLRQANDRGIPCKVFRLPWVGGDSQTGRVGPLRNPYILRYLSFLKMGAMPATVIPANVLPVDVIAEMTLRLFMNSNVPNEIFNISHPNPDFEQEFLTIAEQEFGKKLQLLEQQELQKLLEKVNTKDEKCLFEHNNFVSRQFADVVAVYCAGSSETFFKNVKLLKYIENYGQSFDSSMSVVRRDLLYLRRKGLLEKFGI